MEEGKEEQSELDDVITQYGDFDDTVMGEAVDRACSQWTTVVKERVMIRPRNKGCHLFPSSSSSSSVVPILSSTTQL